MPISLDEKSARVIAKGRIASQFEKVMSGASSNEKYPQKRLAWLRSVEAAIKKDLGDAILFSDRSKRHLLFVALGPIDGKPGWLELSSYKLPFDRPVSGFVFAEFSAHSIARVMERLRTVETISVLREEVLPWSLPQLQTHKAEDLILPTKTGYFVGIRDAEADIPILKTWLPDRLANDRERKAIELMREEARVGSVQDLS